jgi:hypothetical protein
MAHYVADEIVNRLVQSGVKRIYGIVGDSPQPNHRRRAAKWQSGYPEGDLKKILGENVLRVVREVTGA